VAKEPPRPGSHVGPAERIDILLEGIREAEKQQPPPPPDDD
jgi:hypothetical protein